MNIQFATCERHRALEFLKRALPSHDITDTPDSAGPLLGFVEKDIVRVQDPMMYNGSAGIIPSTNWDDSLRDQVVAAGKQFSGDHGYAPEPQEPPQ